MRNNNVTTTLVSPIQTRTYIGASSGDTYGYFTRADTLSLFPQSTAYAGLYDRYRILRVRYKFWWDNDQYPAQPYTGTDPLTNQRTTRPVIWIAKDYDDIVTPTSPQTIWNYGNVKRYDGRSFGFSYKPSVLLETTTGGGTANANALPKWKQWLDLAFNDIYHYGLKWTVLQPVNMGQHVLRYQVTATVQFAGRRTTA